MSKEEHVKSVLNDAIAQANVFEIRWGLGILHQPAMAAFNNNIKKQYQAAHNQLKNLESTSTEQVSHQKLIRAFKQATLLTSEGWGAQINVDGLDDMTTFTVKLDTNQPANHKLKLEPESLMDVLDIQSDQDLVNKLGKQYIMHYFYQNDSTSYDQLKQLPDDNNQQLFADQDYQVINLQNAMTLTDSSALPDKISSIKNDCERSQSTDFASLMLDAPMNSSNESGFEYFVRLHKYDEAFQEHYIDLLSEIGLKRFSGRYVGNKSPLDRLGLSDSFIRTKLLSYDDKVVSQDDSIVKAAFHASGGEGDPSMRERQTILGHRSNQYYIHELLYYILTANEVDINQSKLTDVEKAEWHECRQNGLFAILVPLDKQEYGHLHNNIRGDDGGNMPDQTPQMADLQYDGSKSILSYFQRVFEANDKSIPEKFNTSLQCYNILEVYQRGPYRQPSVDSEVYFYDSHSEEVLRLLLRHAWYKQFSKQHYRANPMMTYVTNFTYKYINNHSLIDLLSILAHEKKDVPSSNKEIPNWPPLPVFADALTDYVCLNIMGQLDNNPFRLIENPTDKQPIADSAIADSVHHILKHMEALFDVDMHNLHDEQIRQKNSIMAKFVKALASQTTESFQTMVEKLIIYNQVNIVDRMLNLSGQWSQFRQKLELTQNNQKHFDMPKLISVAVNYQQSQLAKRLLQSHAKSIRQWCNDQVKQVLKSIVNTRNTELLSFLLSVVSREQQNNLVELMIPKSLASRWSSQLLGDDDCEWLMKQWARVDSSIPKLNNQELVTVGDFKPGDLSNDERLLNYVRTMLKDFIRRYKIDLSRNMFSDIEDQLSLKKHPYINVMARLVYSHLRLIGNPLSIKGVVKSASSDVFGAKIARKQWARGYLRQFFKGENCKEDQDLVNFDMAMSILSIQSVKPKVIENEVDNLERRARSDWRDLSADDLRNFILLKTHYGQIKYPVLEVSKDSIKLKGRIEKCLHKTGKDILQTMMRANIVGYVLDHMDCESYLKEHIDQLASAIMEYQQLEKASQTPTQCLYEAIKHHPPQVVRALVSNADKLLKGYSESCQDEFNEHWNNGLFLIEALKQNDSRQWHSLINAECRLPKDFDLDDRLQYPFSSRAIYNQLRETLQNNDNVNWDQIKDHPANCLLSYALITGNTNTLRDLQQQVVHCDSSLLKLVGNCYEQDPALIASMLGNWLCRQGGYIEQLPMLMLSQDSLSDADLGTKVSLLIDVSRHLNDDLLDKYFQSCLQQLDKLGDDNRPFRNMIDHIGNFKQPGKPRKYRVTQIHGVLQQAIDEGRDSNVEAIMACPQLDFNLGDFVAHDKLGKERVFAINKLLHKYMASPMQQIMSDDNEQQDLYQHGPHCSDHNLFKMAKIYFYRFSSWLPQQEAFAKALDDIDEKIVTGAEDRSEKKVGRYLQDIMQRAKGYYLKHQVLPVCLPQLYTERPDKLPSQDLAIIQHKINVAKPLHQRIMNLKQLPSKKSSMLNSIRSANQELIAASSSHSDSYDADNLEQLYRDTNLLPEQFCDYCLEKLTRQELADQWGSKNTQKALGSVAKQLNTERVNTDKTKGSRLAKDIPKFFINNYLACLDILEKLAVGYRKREKLAQDSGLVFLSDEVPDYEKMYQEVEATRHAAAAAPPPGNEPSDSFSKTKKPTTVLPPPYSEDGSSGKPTAPPLPLNEDSHFEKGAYDDEAAYGQGASAATSLADNTSNNQQGQLTATVSHYPANGPALFQEGTTAIEHDNSNRDEDPRQPHR